MKSFKTKTTEAIWSAGGVVITAPGYPEGVCIPDKRSARALAKWLMKVTEPAKKAPPAEPRVGTKITITTQMDGKLWFNRPGVITVIRSGGAYPYAIDVTMLDGHIESLVFDRNEFKIRK